MAEKVAPESAPASRKAIRDKFYRRYGRAIAAWAEVEQAMAFWFVQLCDPKWEHAHLHISTFYSARSFNGSADMMKATIDFQYQNPEMQEFCKKALAKTGCFYQFRNVLAHHTSTYLEKFSMMVLHRPRDLLPLGDLYTDVHLVIATRNFLRMKRIWADSLATPRYPASITFQEALARVDRLPNEAHSSAPSRRQRGRKIQEQARQRSGG